MNRKDGEKGERIDRIWEVSVYLCAVLIMFFGIQNFLERKLSYLLIVLCFLYAVPTRKFGRLGLTRHNTKGSIIVGAGIGIIYGTIRGLALTYVSGSELVLGADLARIAPRLTTGIEVGPLVLTKGGVIPLVVLLFPAMLGMEMYFRGLLFLNLKRHVHWTGAVAVTSAVQAIGRRTPHSLIMGSIAGILMQKYDNVLAPAMMHAFQFFCALSIFLYLS
ncbi:MAG: CPBP family intramembrane metalloprotease [Candidatus Lindowbacteria bacterium]|nr:CPBP family intramembrane metalloprotease [Candidatus Lindowbacteria bacterium]